jgi:hypothetical protein
MHLNSHRLCTQPRLPSDYAKCIALDSKRRDSAYRKDVFERRKDVDGGLSQAAFIAALKEIEAPVLFSSDNASDDSLFLRADTNASGCVDQSQCGFCWRNMRCVCAHPAFHRFNLAANLPDDLEMFLGEHNLSVRGGAAA